MVGYRAKPCALSEQSARCSMCAINSPSKSQHHSMWAVMLAARDLSTTLQSQTKVILYYVNLINNPDIINGISVWYIRGKSSFIVVFHCGVSLLSKRKSLQDCLLIIIIFYIVPIPNNYSGCFTIFHKI